jgi:hypothetical protein
MTTYANDTFTRVVATGWGTPDTGPAWTSTQPTVSSVNGTKGVMAPTAIITAIRCTHDLAQQDVEIRGTITFAALPAAEANAYLIGRHVDGSNHYRLRARIDNTGVLSVYIERFDGGVYTELAQHTTVQAAAYTAGTDIFARVQFVGSSPTLIRVKVWQGAEPNGWHIWVSDSGYSQQAATQYGAGVFLPAGGTVTFDNVTETSLVIASPGTEYLTETFGRYSSRGWGSPDAGLDWQNNTDANMSIDGSKGVLAMAASRTLVPFVTLGQRDVAVRFDVTIPSIPTGGNLNVYAVGRRVTSGSLYRLNVKFKPGGTIDLTWETLVSSVFTQLFIYTAFGSYSAGDTFSIRCQFIGASPTVMKAKVWKTSLTEPVGWSFIGVDADPQDGAATFPGGQVAADAALGCFADPGLVGTINVSIDNAHIKPIPNDSNRPSGTLVPATGALLGMWVTPDSDPARILAVERDLHRLLDLHHHFRGWTDLPNWREANDVAAGRTPMISWDGLDAPFLTQLPGGTYNAQIDSMAASIKALGVPVVVRMWWEMNGNWERYNGSFYSNSAAPYVTAWQYVHDRFAAQGTTNVIWLWCPNMNSVPDPSGASWNDMRNYYPGDAYVDWVGVDGYNFGTGLGHSQQSLLKPLCGQGGSVSVPSYFGDRKPIVIGETSTTENRPGVDAPTYDKGAWITQLRSDLKQLDSVVGLVFFSEAKERDWRYDSSESSRSAFRGLALDPYFNPDPGGLAFFLPPTVEHAPAWPRIVWSDSMFGHHTPRSERWRALESVPQGTPDLTVAGTVYPGGRWSGPLTDAQVTALIAAGYTDRVVFTSDMGQLPAGLD